MERGHTSHDATAMLNANGEEEKDTSIHSTKPNDSTQYDVDADADAVDCCDHSGDVLYATDDVDDNNDDDALPQCLICFETFVNGDAVTTHCTNKSYHRHCIMEWLLKHDKCPYCRRTFFATVGPVATKHNDDATPTITTTTVPNAVHRNNTNTSNMTR